MKQTIFLLVLFFSVQANAQVRIDSVRFRAEYPSILQFQEYERIFERNEEIAALYFAVGVEDDWKEGRENVAEAADSDKALVRRIHNAKANPLYSHVRDMQMEVVQLAIAAFDDLHNHGPKSKQFKQANDVYQPKLSAYLDTLVSLTEDGFLDVDSATEATAMETEFNRVYPARPAMLQLMWSGNPMKALDHIRNSPDFAKNDVAHLLAADILLKTRYDSLLAPELKLDKDSIGLAYLESILDHENTYSPIYYEAWRKWRAEKQPDFGMAKSSEIPNDLYDDKRYALLRTIGKHIEMHPADLWAYCQFFCLLEVEIIHRFGPYPYGNQSAIERGELFYGPN